MSIKVWSNDKARKVHNQRRYELKRKFGITYEEYQEMIRVQNHSCAICGVTKPGGRGNWHVDHCHETGKIRALLCWACNVGLGCFKDNEKLLRLAATYLKGHQ